jgi:hypothetical protein
MFHVERLLQKSFVKLQLSDLPTVTGVTKQNQVLDSMLNADGKRGTDCQDKSMSVGMYILMFAVLTVPNVVANSLQLL